MPSNRKREDFWAGVLARYEEVKGRTTQKEFARIEGVSFHALARRYQNSQHLKSQQGDALVQQNGLGVFEVDVVHSAGNLSDQSHQSWLEAEVQAGIRVRFTAETNSGYVARLMRQIAGLDRC